MSRPRVAIAHDYLTQRGGAERVVLSLVKAFPDAVVHTTLYDPEGTYPEFADVEIRTSVLNRSRALRHDHRLALPMLAPVSSRLRTDADVTVMSSSGWAHGFAATGKRLIYCHAPARWIYQSENYLGGSLWSSPQGVALAGLRPLLRAWDRRAAAQADRYVCNSSVVRQRIYDAYSIEADVVPAPFAIDTAGPQDSVPDIADWSDSYCLIVSRLLPYKNVDRAIEAVRGTSERLVIVGAGPMADHLRASAPANVRLVSGLTEAQLRWAYAHADLLIAPSLEDYGLTPLEAGSFGKPTVALRAGGYLDTIAEGVNGLFFEASEPHSIRQAIASARAHQFDLAAIERHMARFTEAVYIDQMRAEVDRLLP